MQIRLFTCKPISYNKVYNHYIGTFQIQQYFDYYYNYYRHQTTVIIQHFLHFLG